MARAGRKRRQLATATTDIAAATNTASEIAAQLKTLADAIPVGELI